MAMFNNQMVVRYKPQSYWTFFARNLIHINHHFCGLNLHIFVPLRGVLPWYPLRSGAGAWEFGASDRDGRDGALRGSWEGIIGKMGIWADRGKIMGI